jgi:hypothetical protein
MRRERGVARDQDIVGFKESNSRAIALCGDIASEPAVSHRAVRALKADGQLGEGTKRGSSRYLNNLIEQDHRGVTLRIGQMLDSKRFKTVAITNPSIKRMHRPRKTLFNLGRLRLEGRRIRPAFGTRSSQRNKPGGAEDLL